MYAQIVNENGMDTMLIPYSDIIKNGTPLPRGHGRLKDVDWIDDNCDKRYCGNALCFANEYCEWMPLNTDEIKVGDEVVYHEYSKGVVVRVALECHEPYYVLCANGGMMIRTDRQSLEKTGRHFPQIAEVLEQMKGE